MKMNKLYKTIIYLAIILMVLYSSYLFYINKKDNILNIEEQKYAINNFYIYENYFAINLKEINIEEINLLEDKTIINNQLNYIYNALLLMGKDSKLSIKEKESIKEKARTIFLKSEKKLDDYSSYSGRINQHINFICTLGQCTKLADNMLTIIETEKQLYQNYLNIFEVMLDDNQINMLQTLNKTEIKEKILLFNDLEKSISILKNKLIVKNKN